MKRYLEQPLQDIACTEIHMTMVLETKMSMIPPTGGGSRRSRGR